MTEFEKARARAFYDCRMQVKIARRYEERVAELKLRTIKSPRMDGMPHGGNISSGIEQHMAMLDDLEKLAKQERQQARRAQKRAERYLVGLQLPKALFCRAYYIDAMSDEEAALFADRSVRQCLRFKREIFGSEGMYSLRDQAQQEALEA